MDMIKQYRCTYETYDYFGGHKISTVDLGSNLVEAFSNYKKLKTTDKYYDGEFWTHKNFRSVMTVVKPYNRPHARSAKAWKKMNSKRTLVITEEVWDFILGEDICCDDEDIII